MGLFKGFELDIYDHTKLKHSDWTLTEGENGSSFLEIYFTELTVRKEIPKSSTRESMAYL